MSSGPTSLTWGVMVFNATFNNISAISCRSVLLVEETGVPGNNHRPAASHWQILSHIVVSSTPRQWAEFELTTFVVIDTDCTCSCKFTYHMITTTTAPLAIHAQSVFNRVMSIIQWPYMMTDCLSVYVFLPIKAHLEIWGYILIPEQFTIIQECTYGLYFADNFLSPSIHHRRMIKIIYNAI